MVCKNCGAEILEGMRFCTGCGLPAEVPAPPPQAEPQILEVQPNLNPEVKSEENFDYSPWQPPVQAASGEDVSAQPQTVAAGQTHNPNPTPTTAPFVPSGQPGGAGQGQMPPAYRHPMGGQPSYNPNFNRPTPPAGFGNNPHLTKKQWLKYAATGNAKGLHTASKVISILTAVFTFLFTALICLMVVVICFAADEYTDWDNSIYSYYDEDGQDFYSDYSDPYDNYNEYYDYYDEYSDDGDWYSEDYDEYNDYGIFSEEDSLGGIFGGIFEDDYDTEITEEDVEQWLDEFLYNFNSSDGLTVIIVVAFGLISLVVLIVLMLISSFNANWIVAIVGLVLSLLGLILPPFVLTLMAIPCFILLIIFNVIISEEYKKYMRGF